MAAVPIISDQQAKDALEDKKNQPPHVSSPADYYYPPTDLPIEIEKTGVRYYTQPIPGLDNQEIIMYDHLIPHIPYLAFVKDDRGGFTMRLHKGSTKTIHVQLCRGDENPLRAPFKCQLFFDKKFGKLVGSPDRPSYVLSADNPILVEFYTKLAERIQHVILANKRTLFPKKPSPELILRNYNPFFAVTTSSADEEDEEGTNGLKKSPTATPIKKNYAPIFKVQITLQGKYPTKFLKAVPRPKSCKTPHMPSNIYGVPIPKEQISMETLEKGKTWVPFVILSGIWIVDEKYGMTNKCTTMVYCGESNIGNSNTMGSMVVVEEEKEEERDPTVEIPDLSDSIYEREL